MVGKRGRHRFALSECRFSGKQPVCKSICLGAGHAGNHRAAGHPRRVFDQENAEMDGQRPQLADGERND